METKHQKNYVNRPALWLVALVLIATIVLFSLDIRSAFEPPYLAPALKTLFISVPSLLFAAISLRGFLYSGSWQSLWLGTGTFVYGFIVLVSAWVAALLTRNPAVTMNDISVFFAGIFCLLGAFFIRNRVLPYGNTRKRLSILLQVYLSTLAFLAIIIMVSINEFLPTFFVQGSGGTLMRQMTVASAALLFLVSGLIIFWQCMKVKSELFFWYALGLVLISFGLGGFLLQTGTGTPLNWMVRGAQLLGGIYLLMAALVIRREAGAKQIPAADALANLFSQPEVPLSMVNTIIDPVIVTDDRFRVTFWNTGAEKLYGYRMDEVVGKTVPDVLKSVYSDGKTKDGTWEYLRKHGYYRSEVTQTGKDGAKIIVLLASAALKDENGNFKGLIASHKDITDLKHAEEKLAYLASFPELNPLSVLELNQDGNISYLNPATKKLFPDIEVMKTAHPYLTDYDEVIEQLLENNDSPHTREVKVGDSYFEQVLSLLENSRNLRIYGRDITERKRAEELLKQSYETLQAVNEELQSTTEELRVSNEELQETTEELQSANEELRRQGDEMQTTNEILRRTTDYLNNLLDYASAPIIVWDASYHITRFNHAFERLTGHTAAEMMGKKLDILFPADKRRESMEKIRHTTTSGEHWEVVEIPIQHVDGTVRTVLWNSATLYEADGNTPYATIAQGQDVTERKQAEEALKESEEKYRRIIELANEGVWATDGERKTIFANQRMADMLGYTREELMGRYPLEFLDKEQEQITAETREKLVSGMKTLQEFKFRRKDGSVLWVISSASPVQDTKGHLIGTVSMLTDITERKKAEEALNQYKNNLEQLVDARTEELKKEVATRQQAENEIRELAHRLVKVQDGERASVARDLHDDIGQVLTYLKILIDRADKEKNMQLITQAKSTISDVIKQIRSMCSSLLPPPLEVLGLKEALESLFNQYTSNTQIQVEFNCPELPGTMPLEVRVGIYRIIQEALTNVARHAAVKGVTIRIDCTPDTLNLVVEDKGKGFQPEAIQKTVGLTGMRERARALGGKLTIESGKGRGTRLAAELPLVPPPPQI